MPERLHIQMSEMNQLPSALVERDSMWSLVEFLAFKRVRVSYSYFPSHFTVTFLNISSEAAQELLDDWIRSERLQPTNPTADQRMSGRS